MAMERFNYDEMILLHHVLLRPEKAYVEKQLREMETEDDLLKKLAQSTLEKMDAMSKQEIHELFDEMMKAPMPYL